MTDNFLVSSLVIAVIYVIFKIFEMRVLAKDEPRKPLRLMIRDTIAVYVCALLGQYLLLQFQPIEKIINSETVKVFTGRADF